MCSEIFGGGAGGKFDSASQDVVVFFKRKRPSSFEPFPEVYYSNISSHEKNRIRRCVLCPNMKQIGRRGWSRALKNRKKMYLPHNDKLLRALAEILPQYSLDNFQAPTSLYESCSSRITNAKRPFNDDQIREVVFLQFPLAARLVLAPVLLPAKSVTG
jgi:hypothetical protein